MDTSNSPLITALYGHLEASIYLVQVALKLEWTIFSRLLTGLMVLTFSYIVYILITLKDGRHPLVIWEKLGKPVVKIFRPWTFARLLNNSDPYASSIDMRVSTFSRGFCTAIMRDHHSTHHTQKGIHPTALATFAETIGGLALLSNLRKKDKAILTSIKMEYKKKARGLLTASSDYTLPSDLAEGRHDIITQVVVKDRMLDTVAIGYLVWCVEIKNE
ncbi:uncharacterized protein B0P05DRAFT_94591 [Gilbertella persicaria]|uniref:uncharacterized protein n=1 Tax=Gilbertella persicaria TaxID=101096 RepID=UPI002220266D|nr:uncharacterized protein B0P05DRAFT_94591 [Gilbertella persicaria]KAI8097858.1 hypothetical protein B0P05DRAFT_94591 [Gilbertella persicaria]